MSTPVTLIGRIGADPELRFSPNGVAIVRLRVVTSRRVKEGDDWKDADVTWWTVTAFKRLAERVTERLAKGDPVVIIGHAKSREWETPQGEKRTAVEVVADHVSLDLARVRDAEPSADPWSAGPQAPDAPF